MKTVFNIALAATSIFAIACGGEDATMMESEVGPEALDAVQQEPSSASDEALESASASEALADELEGKVNSYARALLDRDLDALQGLMSTEVLGQLDAKAMDIGAFADKMSNAMLKTFDSMSTDSSAELGFSVQSARIEGNAVRIELSRQGKLLEKPFYFVEEQGEYKLNLVSPGFSQPLPEGAAGSWNNYIVRNSGTLDHEAYCTTGTWRWIAPFGGEETMSCTDKCGAVFSGGRFFANQGQPNENYSLCDYNTWGVDAFYRQNAQGVFYVDCNDVC
jgi:hypothetical protein